MDASELAALIKPPPGETAARGEPREAPAEPGAPKHEHG